MEKSDPSTCSSTRSERWAKFFNKQEKTLQPGSPCNDFKGYCDVFNRCRLVDADGPLARLKKAIFNPELYENIADWIVAHWWAVLLMGIALIMLMAGFIKICSVHTPSSNPKLPQPKPLPGTLTRKRNPQQQQRRNHRMPEHGNQYLMQEMRRWDDASPLFFLVPTTGALYSKELPLPHNANFKELWTEDVLLVGGCSLPPPLSQFANGSQRFYSKLIFQGGTFGSLQLFFHVVLIILRLSSESFFGFFVRFWSLMKMDETEMVSLVWP